MLSLNIIIVLLLIVFVLNGWFYGKAAKWLGSDKGDFHNGIIACLKLSVVTHTLFAIEYGLSSLILDDGATGLVWMFILPLIFYISFHIIERQFIFTTKKTFAFCGILILWGFTTALVATLTLKPYVLEGFTIPTQSLSPTIQAGDKLFANKIISPQRLDFIAFYPTDDHESIFCKRVISMPGERLKFENGNVYINDQLIQLPVHLQGRFTFNIPNYNHPRYEDGQTIQLKDEYFAIGDNLEHSLDSRFTGPIKQANLIGVMDLRSLPIGRFKILR